MKYRIKCLGLVKLLLFSINAYAVQPSQPAWPLEVLSWDIDKAYPGIEYDYRLGVRGGKYPYAFELITAPNGMTIDSVTGVIKWTPSASSTENTVSIKTIESLEYVVS